MLYNFINCPVFIEIKQTVCYSVVSVKFAMVGETNSMVGYHLMAKAVRFNWGSGGGGL